MAINDANEILAVSDWKSMSVEPYRDYRAINWDFNLNAIDIWWKENVWIKGKKCVDVKRWVKMMKKLRIIKNMDVAKRVFYLILYKKNGGIPMEMNDDMGVKDFIGFVCDKQNVAYQEYCDDDINEFIRKCMEKIPNLQYRALTLSNLNEHNKYYNKNTGIYI